MNALSQLLSLKINKFGPAPRFERVDLLRALLKLEKPIGRKQLSKSLDVGEGSIRTLLAHMKEKNVLSTNRKGIALTKKGVALRKTLAEKIRKIAPFAPTPLTFNLPALAFLFTAVHTPHPILLRDEGIRAGARGAVFMQLKNNELQIHSCDSKTQARFKQTLNQLREIFNPQENDLLLLTYGAEQKTLERAGLRILLSL